MTTFSGCVAPVIRTPVRHARFGLTWGATRVGQTVLIRDGYVCIEFFGEVDRETVRGSLASSEGSLAAIRSNGRVLMEFSAVTRFNFDPLLLGEAMNRLAGRGLRIALASSTPEFFGVGRQVAQYSGVEGEAIAVFKDQPAAEEWLLSQPPRQIREEDP